jgi:hypothetical protein
VSECAYPPCSKLWAICRCCYRGHKYCSKACSKLVRVEKKRRYNCDDQRGPGRDVHRDRQRALRLRQAKSASSEKNRDGHTSIEPPSDETLVSARSQEVVLSTEPSARVSESNEDGSPCCRCCGRHSVLVEPLTARKRIAALLRERDSQPQSSRPDKNAIPLRQPFADYVEVIGNIYAEFPITPRALPSNELDVARQLHREGVRLHHVEAALLVTTARRVLGNEPQALEPMCSLRDVVPIIEQARRSGVRQGYVHYLRHKLQHVLETDGAASAKTRARRRSRASPWR